MENKQLEFQITIANESHTGFAQIICDEMAASAQARGTGIAKRSPEYIKDKMREGKAVIAFNKDGIWAGCKSCVNYDILMSKERKNCMCTAMLYDPKDHFEPEETTEEFKKHSKLYERFMQIN